MQAHAAVGPCEEQMKYLQYMGLLLVGLLFFIWPIPHTITARGILTCLCLAVFVYVASRSESLGESLRKFGLPFVLYMLFTLWIVLQALFISAETAWALKEITGQWGNGFIALCIGLSVGISMGKSGVLRSNVLQILLLALVVHVLYIDFDQIIKFIKAGQFPQRLSARGLTEGLDKINYLSSYLLLILGTEVFCRAAYKRRMLAIGNIALASLILATFLSFYFEETRNGTIVMVVLLAVIVGLLLKEAKFSMRKPVAVLLVLAVIASFVYISVKADQRWKTFEETVPVALDTEHNRAWIDPSKYPLPRLPSGDPVEVSAFLRIAWLKEGIILAMEHPLGVGFGRNAFGHGIKNKYNEESGVAHSHNGILDLTIGTGFPGISLWCGFLVSLMFASARQFRINGSSAALLLFLVVANFALRMAADSIMRDHMLQQFMFLVGLLYMFMPGEQIERTTDG